MFGFAISHIPGSVRSVMQHQEQSPATSPSSKSASSVDEGDSTDIEEGEQASVIPIESNDGLSLYERTRQEKIDRNNQRLLELGLGPLVVAGGKKGGGQKRATTKPRRSVPTVPIRIQPARTRKAKYVTMVSSL